ncbi:glycoside hydrolase [Nocardia pseudobrasiliensis]|nr:glycoside hydrolase [Nocardia pseudobrasiliensis]
MTSGRAAATDTPMRYTMTAFTNNSQTDMYVYESTDATNFSLLKAVAYRPPYADPASTPPTAPTDKKGLCRDPSVFRFIDGAYYLTYTTGWDGDTIGFARSVNRVDWDFLYEFRIPIAGIQHTWAPEWFIDGRGGVNVLVTLNTGPGFQPHILTAVDSTLQPWRPTPLLGLSPAPDMLGYIDTTIKIWQNRYYAFVKNESTKLIELAVADSPVGPYQLIRTGDWAGWGSPREGQCVIQLPDGRWRIYMDAYNLDNPELGAYHYSDSVTDDLTGRWTDAAELPGLSGIVRHCTVLPEPLTP